MIEYVWCNCARKLIIVASKLGKRVNKDKWLAGVQIYGGPKASAVLNISEASSLHHEYSSLACTIEIVEDVFAAIDHINKHGRHVQIFGIIFIFVIIITNFSV